MWPRPSPVGCDLARIEHAFPSTEMEPEPEKDSEASQTPSTISDWLDEVGLGPKADEGRAKAGRRKFNYAEKFAEAHYDELGYLKCAKRIFT